MDPIAFGSIHGTSQIWWESIQSTYLGIHPLEWISWEEFGEVFYNYFFSATVVEKKRIEFMGLM